jgi:NitT/TauT family transport system ATP-binding protein
MPPHRGDFVCLVGASGCGKSTLLSRDILHAELERLRVDRGLTIDFVTHNVRVAARLADRVIALSSRPGRVIETFDVDIERPRRIESPAVSALAAWPTCSALSRASTSWT